MLNSAALVPIIDRSPVAALPVSLVRLVDPDEADPIAAPALESGMAQYGMALNTWRALLHRHDHLVRQEIARFRGREVKTLRDGFMAT